MERQRRERRKQEAAFSASGNEKAAEREVADDMDNFSRDASGDTNKLVKLEDLLLAQPSLLLAGSNHAVPTSGSNTASSSASSGTRESGTGQFQVDLHRDAPPTAKDLSLICNSFAKVNRRMAALPILRAIAEYAMPLYVHGTLEPKLTRFLKEKEQKM
ncbi:unnamed protein product, partial [Amoebophrya sp. A120]|eukprot:GSA120T00017045001.1